MQNLPKIGLPVVALAFVIIIFVSKASINIGYGEAGVLFKTFGGGVVTDEPPINEGFHIIAPWNQVPQKQNQGLRGNQNKDHPLLFDAIRF